MRESPSTNGLRTKLQPSSTLSIDSIPALRSIRLAHGRPPSSPEPALKSFRKGRFEASCSRAPRVRGLARLTARLGLRREYTWGMLVHNYRAIH